MQVYVLVLGGHSRFLRENWGGGKGHAIFFRDYLKTTAPPQPVKNEWSLKELLKFCME